MPGSSEILAGLTRIANEAFAIAVAWHGVAALGLIALALGWRVQNRTMALLLTLPLLSVSALAWVHRNPFNGAVFAVIAAALAWAARNASREALRLGAPWMTALGAGLMGFGWAYPHFLVDRSPLAYLYGAPLGTIPCPTLSFVVGSALLAPALGSRSWRLVVASASAFYALIGVARLGVAIDLMLLLGALALALSTRRVASAAAGARYTPSSAA